MDEPQRTVRHAVLIAARLAAVAVIRALRPRRKQPAAAVTVTFPSKLGPPSA